MCNKMSDVRLSNASPTLERVDARQRDNIRPSVRRNLFGTPDPEEIRRHAEAVVQEEVQLFRDTYNFDPVEDRPLTPRNYEWKRDDDPPEFFVRPPHGRPQPRREVDVPEDNNRQDVEERRSRNTSGSRKRRSEASGSCSSEGQNKRLRGDEDDDDDDEEDKGAGSQTVSAEEKRPSRPDELGEVQ